MAKRLQAMSQANYRNGFNVTAHDHALDRPLSWKKPQTIFVNSMSDLFHESVPLEFILRVFDVMARANWHCYQILTKRAERLEQLDPVLPWQPHIWMGVSVENQDYVRRIDCLRRSHAHVKFISFEPLLGPVHEVDWTGIGWAIVGGESGPRARPMREEWVLDIRNACRQNGIPFFFKQWGGLNKKKNGRILQGNIYEEMPSLPACG